MDGLLILDPDGRVADVEGKTLEFKRDLSSPERPLRTIVAFVNSAAGPCSRADLLTTIGLSDAYGNYRRHLLPLVEQGYLARTIPDKPNSRFQRYRLTDAGRAHLDAVAGDAE
ncbi:Fic family protein [Propionibacterium acidifaciens]|uniref:Fic family protein n=1 Tax=Propionibacterium acidifaciens TaxID=556499 RepID=UPI000413F712|nr:hypothetical protein [Propionibacterium acidifaciens]